MPWYKKEGDKIGMVWYTMYAWCKRRARVSPLVFVADSVPARWSGVYVYTPVLKCGCCFVCVCMRSEGLL